MTDSVQVELILRDGGEFIPAILHRGLRPEDLSLIEREWGPARNQVFQDLLSIQVPRSEWPESLHWNWETKAPQLRLLDSKGIGVQCEGKWQGAALTSTEPHVARLEEGRKPLVYVDYIEIAPRNWKVRALGQQGRFRGVGSLILKEIVAQSFEQGFQGRVGLHSLPQSELFYRQVCGMTALSRERHHQDLLYLELSRDGARAFLN